MSFIDDPKENCLMECSSKIIQKHFVFLLLLAVSFLEWKSPLAPILPPFKKTLLFYSLCSKKSIKAYYLFLNVFFLLPFLAPIVILTLAPILPTYPPPKAIYMAFPPQLFYNNCISAAVNNNWSDTTTRHHKSSQYHHMDCQHYQSLETKYVQ